MNAAIVITSIAKPNEILTKWAGAAYRNNFKFIIIGDKKSPDELANLKYCDYYSIVRQRNTGLETAELCPYNHYTRKNIGYLLAIRNGARVIVETDDDNIFYPNFWETRQLTQQIKTVGMSGWVNIYRYFSDSEVWPRGFPLSKIRSAPPSFNSLPTKAITCPVQQGLVDGDPDVDAIYRLTRPLPGRFDHKRRVAISNNAFCPFNSQNTAWWSIAFPLLYLPAYCSFRMTDIWRSIIAQRILGENGWGILFHEATVIQERNDHDLMRDFSDEIPGYLHNEQMLEELLKLALKAGGAYLGENLFVCYEKLVEIGLIDKKELSLLDAWLKDLAELI